MGGSLAAVAEGWESCTCGLLGGEDRVVLVVSVSLCVYVWGRGRVAVEER